MSSAFTPSVVSIATMPTSLSDAEATRLGMKRYVHGTTYNGGIAPTVTLISGGGSLSSVNISNFMPYQIQDGSWRMRFNLTVTLSSASRTFITLAVNGVSFFGSSGVNENVSASTSNSASGATGITRGDNTDRIEINHNSLTTTIYNLGADISLAAKPTWAY